MKEIPLTQGKVAIVDDHNYERLNLYKWHVLKAKRSNTFYARRIVSKKVRILMHNDILDCPTGMQVDHKDRNGLHSWEDNLRVVTSSESQGNVGLRKDNNSGFKGVAWYSLTKRWRVMCAGKHVGYFLDKQEVALAYNQAALKYFGEFAFLNKLSD